MKRVVITGATSGVGAALAKHFSEKGHRVYGLARNGVRLREMELDLANFVGFTADIGVHREVKYAFEGMDRVDILINNAGVYVRAPLHEHLPSDIEYVIGTNLIGTIHVTYCALQKLTVNSRIINISSVAALHGIENESVYCASKRGLDGFMESLELELRRKIRGKKIQITTIYPGGIDTPLWNSQNPYFGNVNDLLTVEDIVKEVESVIDLRHGIIKKKVVMYPSTESH
ncbi:hypothetical protein LCGC14_1070090 [marine sediment metagenome]|uniref:Ketoreductase domain-containing protein n=1 Tax=marine sediment metagenome TaxID=412755 RepID=A0A0F9MNE2_9ZZZZ